MTSANLLVVLFVGTVVGALIGLVLGGLFQHGLYLAIVAGFLATIIAGVVRNTIMTRAGARPDNSSIPVLVIVYSAVASLAGSAAAIEVAHASHVVAPVWIGTLAGLFSGILMSLLMITYHMNPQEPPKRH